MIDHYVKSRGNHQLATSVVSVFNHNCDGCESSSDDYSNRRTTLLYRLGCTESVEY
ncbi:MAG: hypothetical protein ACJAU9_000116 [Lentimonas sp.]|jgi:hypothetical protein